MTCPDLTAAIERAEKAEAQRDAVLAKLLDVEAEVVRLKKRVALCAAEGCDEGNAS